MGLVAFSNNELVYTLLYYVFGWHLISFWGEFVCASDFFLGGLDLRYVAPD